jgi:hypothetical protein
LLYGRLGVFSNSVHLGTFVLLLAFKHALTNATLSRVRQLEQRVESLIGLIAAKETDAPTKGHDSTAPTQTVTPESSLPIDETPHVSPTEQNPRPSMDLVTFEAYDPVDAGVISEQHAYRLVQEFQQYFVWTFPFVVVDVDGPTLRRQEPFLFNAILTVTAYNTPPIQHMLSEQLRHQIGRIVEYSRKSLGILQGLLVYGGWYHGFYHPATQQLTVVVQLCMALVQDLGLSKPTRIKPVKWSASDCSILKRPTGSLAEKRAFLGACFLTVV